MSSETKTDMEQKLKMPPDVQTHGLVTRKQLIFAEIKIHSGDFGLVTISNPLTPPNPSLY